MFGIPVREAHRREVAQAEAKGERDGIIADVSQATGPVQTPKNSAGHSSGRGMPGHVGLRHRTDLGQLGQRFGVSSEYKGFMTTAN